MGQTKDTIEERDELLNKWENEELDKLFARWASESEEEKAELAWVLAWVKDALRSEH